MAGQIYVGNGYRQMLESLGDLTEIIEIKMELELLEKKEPIWNNAIVNDF